MIQLKRNLKKTTKLQKLKGINIISLFALLFIACQSNSYEGKFGYSTTLNESLRNESFDFSIMKDTNIHLKGDSTLSIRNVFIESCWRYGRQKNLIKKTKGRQLIIELEPNVFSQRYLLDWIIISSQENSTHKIFGKIGEHSLFFNLEENQTSISAYVLIDTDYLMHEKDLNDRLLGEINLDW